MNGVFRKMGAVVVGAVGLLVSGLASATSQIDAAALTAAGTDITDTANALLTWSVPIVGIILAMTKGISLFKRFAGKA